MNARRRGLGLWAVVLAGCPGDEPDTETETDTGEPVDDVAPTVVASTPLAGSHVSPRTPSVTFSEPMDAATLTAANVTLEQILPTGDVGVDLLVNRLDDAVTIELSPTSVPLAGAAWRLTVGTGVTDLAGNAIATPFVAEFELGSASPGVVAAPGPSIGAPIAVASDAAGNVLAVVTALAGDGEASFRVVSRPAGATTWTWLDAGPSWSPGSLASDGERFVWLYNDEVDGTQGVAAVTVAFEAGVPAIDGPTWALTGPVLHPIEAHGVPGEGFAWAGWHGGEGGTLITGVVDDVDFPSTEAPIRGVAGFAGATDGTTALFAVDGNGSDAAQLLWFDGAWSTTPLTISGRSNLRQPAVYAHPATRTYVVTGSDDNFADPLAVPLFYVNGDYTPQAPLIVDGSGPAAGAFTGNGAFGFLTVTDQRDAQFAAWETGTWTAQTPIGSEDGGSAEFLTLVGMQARFAAAWTEGDQRLRGRVRNQNGVWQAIEPIAQFDEVELQFVRMAVGARAFSARVLYELLADDGTHTLHSVGYNTNDGWGDSEALDDSGAASAPWIGPVGTDWLAMWSDAQHLVSANADEDPVATEVPAGVDLRGLRLASGDGERLVVYQRTVGYDVTLEARWFDGLRWGEPVALSTTRWPGDPFDLDGSPSFGAVVAAMPGGFRVAWIDPDEGVVLTTTFVDGVAAAAAEVPDSVGAIGTPIESGGQWRSLALASREDAHILAFGTKDVEGRLGIHLAELAHSGEVTHFDVDSISEADLAAIELGVGGDDVVVKVSVERSTTYTILYGVEQIAGEPLSFLGATDVLPAGDGYDTPLVSSDDGVSALWLGPGGEVRRYELVGDAFTETEIGTSDGSPWRIAADASHGRLVVVWSSATGHLMEAVVTDGGGDADRPRRVARHRRDRPGARRRPPLVVVHRRLRRERHLPRASVKRT
jgi:hypothetical protein